MIFRRKQSVQPMSRREIIAKRRQQAGVDTEAGEGGRSFQRNRNIASGQKEPISDSKRQAWHELRQKRHKLITGLIGVGFGIIFIITLLTQFIGEINVQSMSLLSKDQKDKYVGILNDYLSSHPMERLRFLIHEDSLKAFFIMKAPEVSSVTVVGTSDIAKSNLKINFREPVAQWIIGSDTYFVDSTGSNFKINYFAPPNLTVDDKSGIKNQDGIESVNQRLLSQLGLIVSLFKAQNLQVEQIILPEGSLRQLDVHLSGRPYAIRMTINRDAEPQVNEAIYAINYFDSTNQSPEYINVQVNQKVFYK